jgi:hypothetical protein
MEDIAEIKIIKNHTRNILLIFIIPLLLTFITEHFGDFTHKSYGGQISTLTLVDSYFTSPFGSIVEIPDGEKAYNKHSDGIYKIFGYYTDKLPYYLKALTNDIIYPVAIIILILFIYFLKNKNHIFGKNQMNINGKLLSAFSLILLLGIIGFGYWQYKDYESKLSWLESKNYELNDIIKDLESEKEELKSELDDAESNTQYYQQKVSQNEISVESNIEYGLLKKYGLTHFIVADEDNPTYHLGQLRVKFRVNGYKEYSELLKAQEKDLFMKYITILNNVYDGDGLDHFYEFYPY